MNKILKKYFSFVMAALMSVICMAAIAWGGGKRMCERNGDNGDYRRRFEF